ncbi:cytosolic thiouridylase subunit 2 [Aphomia sociella]
MSKCKKCEDHGTIILRKKDYYCDTCFLTSINHKFRSCIGKNKILRSNENILFCLSGGAASTVLLDLVHNGISLDNHKKLRVTPYALHLIGPGNTEENVKVANSIIKTCKSYNFNVYVVHMAEYVRDNSIAENINVIPAMDSDSQNKFCTILNSLPPTARNDFLMKVKQNLYIRSAKELCCKFVFTAETTTTLAINLLSNLTVGRGSQVHNDVGFCDKRDDEVTILRPMREISSEELDQYLNTKQIGPVHDCNVYDNSLQSVIKSFVSDLQENFQATVSTVCKTADKIGVYDDKKDENKCVLCESVFSGCTSKVSALEATNYSKIISSKGREDNDESRLRDVDMEEFNILINAISWERLLEDDVNQTVLSFNAYITYVFDVHVPIKKLFIKYQSYPWITPTIREMMKLRDRAYAKSRSTRLESDIQYYKDLKSEILERVVSQQLKEFLDVNNILPQKQSGFRAGRSTATALLDVVDDILSGEDEGSSAQIDRISSFKVEVKIGDTVIEQVTEARNLGVLFDNRLRFHNHILETVKNCYYRLRVLYQMRDYLDVDLRIKLCESLILSKLNYADTVIGECLFGYTTCDCSGRHSLSDSFETTEILCP